MNIETIRKFRRKYLCPRGIHWWTKPIEWKSGRTDKHCKCCPELIQEWKYYAI